MCVWHPPYLTFSSLYKTKSGWPCYLLLTWHPPHTLWLCADSRCCPLQVNEAFREAANGKSKGILAVSDLPLVSCDFKKSDVSTTIDASLTMVMGDDMVKVVAW